MISGAGFFSKIGSGLSALTGGILGSSPKGFQDPHLREYSESAYGAVKDRGKLGYKPLTGAGGVREATRGFSFSPVRSALTGLGRESNFEKTGPYQFNFQHLPEQYEGAAYNRAVGDTRREAAGANAMLRNTVGNRRLGLLASLGDKSRRDLVSTLGKTRTDFGLERMREDVELGRAQQEAQAGENRATGSAQAAERRARLGAQGDLGTRQIGLQSDLTERERSYRDQAMDYLMQMYNAASGQSAANANLASQRRGQTIQGVAAAAGMAGGG